MVNVLNSLIRAYKDRIDHDVTLRLMSSMGIEVRVPEKSQIQRKAMPNE